MNTSSRNTGGEELIIRNGWFHNIGVFPRHADFTACVHGD